MRFDAKRLLPYRHVLLLVGFFVITTLFYYSAVHLPFFSDDYEWLLSSINRPVLDFFVTNTHGVVGEGNYGPVVNVFYAAIHAVFGQSAGAYHVAILLLHICNAFVMTLLVERYFSWRTAALSGLAFLTYMNHVEALAWVAVVPHLISALGLLILCYGWSRLLQSGKWYFGLMAVLAFSLGVFAKETVLVGLVLVALMFAVQWRDALKHWAVTACSMAGLAGMTALYFVARYKITGILFGYYSNTSLTVRFGEVAEQFNALLLSTFTTGALRTQVLTWAVDKTLPLFITFVAAFGILGVWFWLRDKRYVVVLASFLFLLTPFTFLITAVQTTEGERYLYVPALALAVFAGSVLSAINREWLRRTILAAVLIISLTVVHHKLNAWEQAGELTREILSDFDALIDPTLPDVSVVLIGLPDNHLGAQVFRNGIREAITLRHPEHSMGIFFPKIQTVFTAEMLKESFVTLSLDQQDKRLIGSSDRQAFTGLGLIPSTDFTYELTGLNAPEDRPTRGYRYEKTKATGFAITLHEDMLYNMENYNIHYLYMDFDGLHEIDLSSFIE